VLVLTPNPASITDITPDDFARIHANNPQEIPNSSAECVTCRGRGTFTWYPDGNPSREPVEYECNCEEQIQLYLYLLASGIGLRYQRLGWEDVDGAASGASKQMMKYLEKAEAYVRHGIGLVLHGDRGTGKTLFATLWLKGMIARGFDGQFSTFQDILDLYQSSWRKDDEKRAFERRVVNATLLVIDDIGRENQGRLGVAGELVDRVIRNRVSAQRPTVITTNKTPEELAELYSLNALSLLSGCTRMIEFVGTDYRPEGRDRDDREIDLNITRPIVLF
jgi:DNA replication protein DnaC